MNQKTSSTRTYTGGCHCGAVRFEADLDLSQPATRCNCSICQKTGVTSMGGKPDILRVTSGAEHIGEYRVTPESPNYRGFCKKCGVQCFGRGDVPEIGGPFASVSVNCLDDVDLSTLTIGYFDGWHDNWMAGLRATPWPTSRLQDPETTMPPPSGGKPKDAARA
jgi:hypothetical protein